MVKIFIGNLGDTGAITSNDLREAFEKYGPVTESECVKNYAFVHMQYKKDADDALRDLNGVVLKGNINIKIKMFDKKLKYKIYIFSLLISLLIYGILSCRPCCWLSHRGYVRFIRI